MKKTLVFSYLTERRGVRYMYKVDNAVILAAGTASRFAPLSYEYPKALISVRGEVLIERQIRQLQEAGVNKIYVVVGYKADMFTYLEEKFGVELVYNPDYLTRNNNASIYVVRDKLKNSYICSSDNYFSHNPFEKQVESGYYAALYANGLTKEWCLQCDEEDVITHVQIGGENAWYMMGHVFWDERFSRDFLAVLEGVYNQPETVDLLWESIYMQHLDQLKLKIRRYRAEEIFEFDTLDELRIFDVSYEDDTRSPLLRGIARQLEVPERELRAVESFRTENNSAAGFRFFCQGQRYEYRYEEESLRRI